MTNMATSSILSTAVLFAALFAIVPAPAHAQSNDGQAPAAGGTAYESGTATAPLSIGNLDTPEANGRPGVKFYAYGAQALKKHDYAHAIDMFKVSASWAYKPAQYLLGLMYFNGTGVTVDRPLGAAWMILAAEPGNPSGSPAYAKTRDEMITVLTDAQFKQTDGLWSHLKKTYGDKVALRRAKAQWAYVKSQQTGTRVGGNPGELHVGAFNMRSVGHPSRGGGIGTISSALGLLQSGSVDGSIAYRQFQQSNNPYSPMFLKNPIGNVTVGALQKMKHGDQGKAQPGNEPAAASSGQSPQK